MSSKARLGGSCQRKRKQPQIKRGPIKILFYDFEVFKYNWLVVVLDMTQRKKHAIWDDRKKLERLYSKSKSEIWVGFNSKHYDQYIFKGILAGFDPKEINDWIIVQDRPGWEFSDLLPRFPLYNYDVMSGKIDKGLKTLEGFMGHNIKESSVPFDIDRPLTDTEKAETELYCTHDVEETVETFILRKADFEAQMGLIEMFPEVLSLSDISKTKAQLSAKILECKRPNADRNDEFDISILSCIQINKYKAAVEFFLNPKNHWYRRIDERGTKKKNEFTMMIAGVEHTLGWGGIHAGKEQYQNLGKQTRRQIWHVDVASFYPRLMIFHNFLTRNCRKPEKFKMIYEKRLELKHAGKKKEQAPLKIVINGTYGISKAETSDAYDPRNANLICVNGQLMLIDLIEHLEEIKGFELIQSNTDGLIVSLPDTDEAFQQMDDICYEWESRCNMELEFDEISAIWEKDVNNYVFKFSNGKLERKGTYVKELSDLDYDLPIVNKAMVDFMVKGVPVEVTISNCNDLKEFQQVKKISNKYKYIQHGGKILKEKCVRCFASKNQRDGGLIKIHATTGRPAKIESTPKHAFLWNDSVEGVPCPATLDKQWYIELANKRLKDFGVI